LQISDSTFKPEQNAPTEVERKSVSTSFHYAWEGIQFCFDTQRHMRVHFTLAVLVLLAAWTVGVEGSEFMHLMAAIAIVLIAEMLNTALEACVDLIVQGYDPRAKVVKDVAAGAVLFAAIYAISVAIIVFSTAPRVEAVFVSAPERPPVQPLHTLQLVVTGVTLLCIFITWLKRATGYGTLWRGGVVSGHSALGFFGAVVIMLLTHDIAVMLVAISLAVLMMQSRLQARIHTMPQVLLGALAGALMGLLLFIWYFN